MTFDPLRTLPLLVGTPALPLLGRETTVTTNRERERGERESKADAFPSSLLQVQESERSYCSCA